VSAHGDVTPGTLRDAPAATTPAPASATGAAIAALNLAWADGVVEALRNGGVADAVVCPGSRSAPLVLAIDRHGLRTHVVIDERAGGYFALGLAKASRRPVAIVTTSGTATANLHPAVLEAYHARVPLVILTADRPPELRDAGAPQTVDQIRIFGTAARWFHEVGAPSADLDGLVYTAALGTRAAATALGPPAGPVHLNFAFREPLIPEPEVVAAPVASPGLPAARDPAARDPAPPVRYPAPETIERIARILKPLRRGLIACGPENATRELAPAIARLAAATGYPVLADPASQVRYGAHDRARIVGAYDGFLRSPRWALGHSPEVILQFGAPLTSKAFHQYLAAHPRALRILVDPAGEWREPSRRAAECVAAEPAVFASLLAEALFPGADAPAAWSEAFARAERAARAAVEEHRAELGPLTEGTIFPSLLEAAPEETIVYVGNSMPIRDLDLHAPASAAAVRVLANRGVSGIDGVLSSALGASAAGDAPVLAILGDLSFHHDLNGLAALREGRAHATIVVVNNDGGGIFSFLPASRHTAVFERYFGTPHGLDLERAAALYGLRYARPRRGVDLAEAVAASLAARETTLLEVRSDRSENVALHRRLTSRILSAVDDLE
jgi:2-succinyl-5-enolpyruvyl-6-hydroxy-3-cyclohexene-1-carboxylate synthase